MTEPSPPVCPASARRPPRVRKPRRDNDRYVAPPTVDLEDLRARLREAFGNTASDEFVGVMMRKLIVALSPFGDLEEATLNAGDGGHEFSWAKRLANGIPNEFIYQKAQCLQRSAQNMGRVPIPADAIVAHQVDGEAGKLVSPPFGLI